MEINHKGDYVLVVCPNPAVDIFAWIENFKVGSSNRIIKEKRFPGGKGVHVAMALAELEVEVVLLGFWGSLTGEWIKQACKDYYPKLTCVGPTLADWSRSCYTFKSGNDFNDTEILGLGPQINNALQTELLSILKGYLENAKAIACCGSWPKGASEDGYQQIIQLGNQYNIPTFLDCTGTQLKNALKAQPFAIHLNRREVLEYTETNTLQTAQDKISKLCTVSAITDGEKGLYLNDGENTYHSLAKIEEVYSTIGSGDCLLAGIITGFVRQQSYPKIANLGAACGAANCIYPNLGMIQKRDVYVLLEKMS